MDAVAELGRNPVISTRFSLSMEISRLTRDGTAEPVSRDQSLRHERGQGNIQFACSADHVQNGQPYPVDPYSCYMCDHTYIQHITQDFSFKHITRRISGLNQIHALYCTDCTVQYDLLSVHCTVRSTVCTLYSTVYCLHTVRYGLLSTHCTVQ